MAVDRIRLTDGHSVITRDEYLALDDDPDARYEFDDGVITAMSGASSDHGFVTQSIAHHLQSAASRRKCKVLSQGMRVHIPSTKRYYYPDVTVVCRSIQIERDRGESLLNPVLVAEVLSSSTKRRDRGVKLVNYKAIPTLQYYLIVDPTLPHVELHWRSGDVWVRSEANGLDATIELADIGCSLKLSEIYDQVELDDTVDGEHAADIAS